MATSRFCATGTTTICASGEASPPIRAWRISSHRSTESAPVVGHLGAPRAHPRTHAPDDARLTAGANTRFGALDGAWHYGRFHKDFPDR